MFRVYEQQQIVDLFIFFFLSLYDEVSQLKCAIRALSTEIRDNRNKTLFMKLFAVIFALIEDVWLDNHRQSLSKVRLCQFSIAGLRSSSLLGDVSKIEPTRSLGSGNRVSSGCSCDSFRKEPPAHYYVSLRTEAPV